MPFEKVRPEKLSRGVVRQVEQLILRGVLRPGDRLPAERELAERMGVSRPSLREALAELQSSGLLESRAGSGVYVADVLGSAFSEALVRLFSAHDEALFDALSFRRDMEGLAAERAARLASDTDLAVIAERFARMEDVSTAEADPDAEARRDADFHLSIIEAGHNVVLLHMMRSMYDLLREGVFYNRRAMFGHRTTREELLAQHRRILRALQARDPAGARAAVESHLDYIREALSAERRRESHETTARKRYQQVTR